MADQLIFVRQKKTPSTKSEVIRVDGDSYFAIERVSLVDEEDSELREGGHNG